MKLNDYKALYASEAEEILQALENGVLGLEGDADYASCVDDLFRNAHNLKGISGAMGYDFVVEASHSLENVLDRLRREEIKISPSKINLLLHAIDLLRKLVQYAVDGGEKIDSENLLGEILVSLSPMCVKPGGDGRVREGEDTIENEGNCDTDEFDKEADSEGAEGEASKTEEQRSAELPAPEETALSAGDGFSPGITSIRIDIERLDRLMDLVGELMIGRIRLGGIAHEQGNKQLLNEIESSGRLITEIQREVMEARLVPVEQVFQRFKRLVRDISSELGKKVELRTVGAEIGLDRTVLESMIDPFVHLIRNAIDHGIETPEEREALEKDPCGKISLSARRERNFVILEIADDGQGIDLAQVKKKSSPIDITESGDTDLSEEELCRILATPGFSTSRTIGRYSGRGMGMNIVKKVVDSFGGSMRLQSEPGNGTVVSLQLPVNLSIIKALLFRVRNDIHALPIEYVRETTRMEMASLRSYRGHKMLETKEGFIPVVKPWEVLGLPSDQEDIRYVKVIIVDTGEGSVGLLVNRIIGQQEIVIKGLPELLRGINGISGATILGSGKISFIWDPRVLFQGRCLDEFNKEAVVLEN
ncbi:MAG: chemotaxis protein CheA [bacterium]|nr:MAG: chemotaxis protein CheA [bacterium]